MSERANRREALRLAARRVAQAAEEIATPWVELRQPKPKPKPPPTPPAAEKPREPPVQPAGPSTHVVGDHELAELIEQQGLGARRAELERFVRPSVRATPSGESTGESRIGGGIVLPDDFDWPSWLGVRLTPVARFDLGAAGIEGWPEDETMIVFMAPVPPSGLEPGHAGGYRVISIETSRLDAAEGGVPLELSREIQMPRPWLSAVTALDLDDDEREAWTELRLEIGRRQGVEPHDTTNRELALHRLFGFPDERRGDMRLACELLDRGESIAGQTPASHPLSKAIAADAERWHLVAQLTRSATPDAVGGGHWRRVYFWADEDALRRRDFSSVRAIRR